MGDKVDYQHGGTADGKSFPATAPIKSPEFGVASGEKSRDWAGGIPGSAPRVPLYPDPELPN